MNSQRNFQKNSHTAGIIPERIAKSILKKNGTFPEKMPYGFHNKLVEKL